MIQTSTKFNAAPPVAKPFADEQLRLPKARDALQAVKPDPNNEVRRVRRRLPNDLRFLSWVERQIGTPRIIRRFLLWSFRNLANRYAQARMLVTVLRSPKIADEGFEKRQEICRACSENDDGYCRACNCPRWIYAQLDRKNWRAGWLCPRAKHPGEYPQYGCPGCGKSQAVATPQRVEV